MGASFPSERVQVCPRGGLLVRRSYGRGDCKVIRTASYVCFGHYKKQLRGSAAWPTARAPTQNSVGFCAKRQLSLVLCTGKWRLALFFVCWEYDAVNYLPWPHFSH